MMKSARGFIMLPVVLAITVVAMVVLVINHEATTGNDRVASQKEVLDASYAAQAGLAHELWRIKQAGCGPYTNIASTSLGNHSYTATVTTDLGSTTSYTFQVDQDAWIRSDLPTNNMASDPKLHIRYEAGTIERPMYRYDLSSLPANATILSATAWFYLSKEHPEGPVDIHQLTTDWTDTGATWETMGDKMDSAVVATIPATPNSGVWIPINLTAQVQTWVNGQPNYGITLNSSSEGTHGDYASIEAGQKPYLEVIVGTPPSSPAVLQSVGTHANGISRTITRNDVTLYQQPLSYKQPRLDTGAGQDARIDSFYTTRNYGNDAKLDLDSIGTLEYSLIRFNLQAIPPDARIQSARLELYHTATAGTPVDPGAEVHRVMRDWVEGTKSGSGTADGVTWKTWNGTNNWTQSGGDYDVAPIASGAISAATNDWETWEIGELVQRWVDGTFPNYGLVLKGTGSVEVSFASKEDANPSLHPRLSINFSCECGQACVVPQGSGKVAMVVNYPTLSIGPSDRYKKDLFEAWGYQVDAYDDNFLWLFNPANYDVVYVSETVNPTAVGTQLSNLSIGVVNEEGWLNDELGMESGNSSNWPVGNNITITDNSHYITQPFPAGSLQIYDADMGGLAVGTTPAPDLQPLASWSSGSTLGVLEAGAADAGGGTVAGRRVMLPVGKDSDLNWSQVNNNGRLIVQRALQWGTGNTAVSVKKLLLVVVDPTNLTPQETAKRSLIESWDYTVELIDVNADQASFDAAVANNDVVFITEDINSGDLGTKLVNATIGVVTEETNLSDEFGLSDGIAWESGTQIEINDNTHYITSPFPTGMLTVLSTSESLAYATPTFAPELLQLASSASGYGVIAVDADAAVTAGGFAAGRRVMLPWGGDDMDVNHLNADGLTIFQRSLEWGAEAIPSDPIYLSSDSAATLGGLNFDDIDIAEYDPDGDSASLFFEGALTTLVSDIDALHVLEDGHILLSTTDDASLGGLSFLDGDLVKYNPATDTATLYFDESKFTDNEDIISVYVMDNGHILLSTDSDATLGGLNFTDNDLVEYDPGSNTATLYFDGSATTLVSDIDAVHLLKNGHIVLSTKDDASLGGLSFKDGDLVDYNPATDTAVLYFDEGLFAGNEDVISVHVGPGSGGTPVPIAHWKLDETSGPTAVDSEGGNDGTLAGDPTWSTGNLDGALDFDGVGDRVDVGPVLDAATPRISVTAWVYKRDSGDDRVISKSTGTSIPDHIFSLGVANTTIRVRLKTTDNGGTSNYDGGVMPLDQWVHLAFTYDGSQLKIYRDGVETASLAVTGDMVASSQDVAIGNVNSIDDRYWNGLLDDVRIYDRALYPFEIADLVAAGGGGGGGGGGDNLRDEFTADSFGNNDGTLNWTSDWIEVDGNGVGETSGNAQISGGILNLDDAPNTDGEPSLAREADLSAYTTATLTFTYATTSGVDGDDTVVLDISNNGGSSWTPLETFLGPVSGSASYDISAYIATNSQIRFRVTNLYGGSNEQFQVDNLDIAVSGP